MTDGERLVWAAAFALAIERDVDGPAATKVATRTVQRLREVADTPTAMLHLTFDERDMLDEIARVP